MKRSSALKFPSSVQLFKFCQRVLAEQKNGKIHDQDIGSILSFNPSDCSHWKRGEKNIKSVFSYEKLSKALQVELSILYDIASSQCSMDEGFFDYQESKFFEEVKEKTAKFSSAELAAISTKIEAFVQAFLDKSEAFTPPLYLPEILRHFPFVSLQPMEMMDKLSRILRKKPGQYIIHHNKGEMKAQTRASIAKDLARIIFEAERAQFPQLGAANKDLLGFEILCFCSSLLVPRALLLEEVSKVNLRRNLIQELSTQFWAPRSVITFKLQDLARTEKSAEGFAASTSKVKTQSAENNASL